MISLHTSGYVFTDSFCEYQGNNNGYEVFKGTVEGLIPCYVEIWPKYNMSIMKVKKCMKFVLDQEHNLTRCGEISWDGKSVKTANCFFFK